MSEKGKSILSYVFGWIGGLIVLFAMKDSTKNTKVHAAQAICIGVGYMAISTLYGILPFSIPFFSSALRILYFVLLIMGIVKANKEEDPELPVVGGLAKSIFGKKIDEAVEDTKKEETKEEAKEDTIEE